MTKKLSNPFSTGAGGARFESRVQSLFVTLMLSRGSSPCLPSWPICEIKLQCKIDGYDTDDIMVTVEDPETKEKKKLLCQIKHNVNFTNSDPTFNEVIDAAWGDYNKGSFKREKDAIALITSPLNRTDQHLKLILEQARCTSNVDEFYRNVQQANFISKTSLEKFRVLSGILNRISDHELSENEIYIFLKHYHIRSCP